MRRRLARLIGTWFPARLLQPLAVTALLVSVTGCGTPQRGYADPLERTWQAAHAIDALQTRTLIEDPCLQEGDPVTQAMIGREPSEATVAAWAIGGSLAHAAVTGWLTEAGYTRTARAWQFVTLGQKAAAVVGNHRLGVRIIGGNKGCGR